MTADLRAELVALVRAKGLRRLPEPVVLASGQRSRDFVDAKVALAHGDDLELACRTMLSALDERGITGFDAIGGLTMGADQFAHVGAVLARCLWFVVRKEPKGRGTNQLVEGAPIGPGTRVVLVDDVVTTGGSIRKAHEVVTGLGAEVAAAVTLVDRGDVATAFFAERGVPYVALVSYRDLAIEPIVPVAT